MKFKTETGTRYEIIDNETVRKNDVFLFNYVLSLLATAAVARCIGDF